MTAMTIFQLIGLCTCSTGKQLIAQTDTHQRLHRLVLKERADMLNGLATTFRVARTISQEESVELQLIEVIVPRHAHHLYTTIQKTTDDVCLHTAVNKHNALEWRVESGECRVCYRCLIWLIGDHFFAAHLLYPVHGAVIRGI